MKQAKKKLRKMSFKTRKCLLRKRIPLLTSSFVNGAQFYVLISEESKIATMSTLIIKSKLKIAKDKCYNYSSDF